jgi:hypothetical protein
MQQEIDILIQYGKADMGKRLHLFLQFPDLRSGFQEIERNGLAAQLGSTSLREEHIKEKCARSVILLGATYRRITKTKTLKHLLRSLRPSKTLSDSRYF